MATKSSAFVLESDGAEQGTEMNEVTIQPVAEEAEAEEQSPCKCLLMHSPWAFFGRVFVAA